MSWILVIIASVSDGGIHVQTVDMDTKKLCERAAVDMEFRGTYQRIRTFCVRKK